MASTKNKFPKFGNVCLYIIFSYVFQLYSATTVTPSSSNLESSSNACYKATTVDSLYFLVEKKSSLIEWPNFLTVDMYLTLVGQDASDTLQREQRYILKLYDGPCTQSIEVSNQHHNTRIMLIFIKMYLNYFQSLFTQFSASIDMSQPHRLIKFTDQYGHVSLDMNIVSGKTLALPSMYVSDSQNLHKMFGTHIRTPKKCIVLMDAHKSHLLFLDSRVSNIPWFRSITANVKYNGNVYKKTFPGYSVTCPTVSSGNPTPSVIAYVDSIAANTVIEWQVTPTRNVNTNYRDPSSTRDVFLTATNIDIRSVSDTPAADSLRICSAYLSNSIYLFETQQNLDTCVRTDQIASKITGHSGSLPLETYIRDLTVVGGHKFDKWVPQQACNTC